MLKSIEHFNLKLNNVDSKYAKQATEGKNSNVVELLNRMAKAVLVNG